VVRAAVVMALTLSGVVAGVVTGGLIAGEHSHAPRAFVVTQFGTVHAATPTPTQP
jgi:hypothetical protein